MDDKKTVMMIVAGVLVAVLIISCPKMFDTVDNGTYQIRQWPVSGQIDAKMTPGLWWQCFGDIQVWPKAETFYFTHDAEGGQGDASIEITFNDGSKCRISGTCRVEMPKTEKEATALISDRGFKNHNEVEEKLIKPCLRNALILTANLMTARESYSEKRIDFLMIAWDQVQHGLYEVEEVSTEVKDPVSGQITTRKLKTIMKDKEGRIVRQPNSNILEGTGITLSNFEIKQFVYEDVVQKQISQQQEATMSITTAMAQAKKAEQDKLKIEAEGKAAVTKAQYEKEQEKIRAVTDALKEREVAVTAADRDKQVAVTKADQEKEVAKLQLDAARMEKERQIALGEGEARRKELVMAADGALEKKLEAWLQAQRAWADAFAKRNVPSVVMGAEKGGQDTQTSDFMSLLTAKAAKDLALSVEVNAPQHGQPSTK